jgi:Holliday junction resolvase
MTGIGNIARSTATTSRTSKRGAMPGKAPREKGKRLERLCVALLTAAGLDAKRVPLSGSARGFKGDVIVTAAGYELRFECKSRRKGFAFIYDAIGENDAAIIKTDREEPIVCIPLRRLARLIGNGGLQR